MSNNMIAELVELYLQHLEARQASAAHLRNTAFRLHILAGAFPDITNLDRVAITRWYANLRRADGEPYASASLAGFVGAVQRFCAFLVKQGVLTENVADHLKRPRYRANPDRVARRDDVESVAAYLELHAQRNNFAPIDVRDALIVSLSIDSGARRGELHNLTRNDFAKALERPVLTQHGSLYRIRSHGKTGEVLLRFGERSAWLGRHWLRVMPPSQSPRLLLSTRDGRVMHVNGVVVAFDRVCAAAGVERFTSHAVRHYNVTKMMRRGHDPKLVSKYVNHSSPDVTLSVYRHLAEYEVDEAAAALMDEPETGRSPLAEAFFTRHSG